MSQNEYVLNEGQGSLFKQDKEEKKSENSPDYRGKINIGGQTYRISGWLKLASSGTRWISLAAQPMQDEENSPSTGQGF